MIILDTNVVSEAMKPQPDENFLGWTRFLATEELFTTAVTEAEMRYGVARLPASKNRREIAAIIDDIFARRFHERILPFDGRAAKAFADISISMRKQGRMHRHADAQIAAIAQVHGASVATRDRYGFEHSGVPLIDPWDT